MSVELYLVFVLATALLIATPGPNVAAHRRPSLTHGARDGSHRHGGREYRRDVQLVVVAAGLAWIVEAFSRNFDLIRFVGAAYPFCLAFRRCGRRARLSRRSRCRRSAHFSRGLAVAFANPKTLIFQAAFLPQFLSNGEGRAGAALAARRDLLDRHGHRRCDLGAVRRAPACRGLGPGALIADRVSGAILIAGAGVLLAASRR